MAFVECKKCNTAFQRAEGEDRALKPCLACGKASNTRAIDAWTFKVRQSRTASPPAKSGGVHLDGFTHLIRGITLAAAGGTAIPNGSHCLIGFGDAGIQIAAESQRASVDEIPYADVQGLEATGTTTRRSAGLMGGGFGLTGAAEGMLAASVINSLTARTHISTVLRIATVAAEYVFVSDVIGSEQLRMFLIPIQPRIRQAQAAAPTVRSQHEAPPSVADELTKLAALRRDGILSDAEFASAKARLLSDP